MTNHPYRDLFLAILGGGTLLLAGVAMFNALHGLDNLARWAIGLAG